MTERPPRPGPAGEAPLTLDRFFERYREVQRDGYAWAELDRALLALCERLPDHTDAQRNFGKVALINRAYGANLHMGGKEAEREVAEALVSSDLDAHLAGLRRLDTFDLRSAPAVMAAHDSLVSVCRGVTHRKNQSFASKYLAFHAPKAVPLFDAYAERAGKQLVSADARAPLQKGISGPYGAHCATVLALMSALRQEGLIPDVKRIDVVLYSLAGGRG